MNKKLSSTEINCLVDEIARQIHSKEEANLLVKLKKDKDYTQYKKLEADIEALEEKLEKLKDSSKTLERKLSSKYDCHTNWNDSFIPNRTEVRDIRSRVILENIDPKEFNVSEFIAKIVKQFVK